jgi:hypothetical protein
MDAETEIGDETLAVGWYDGPDGPVAFPATQAFFDAATIVAERRLAELGVRAGDVVIICSQSAEVLQFAPYERASNTLHAAFTCVESSRIDGPRLRSFIDLFRPRAVLGVNSAVIDGIDLSTTSLAEVFARVEIVAAKPTAHALLRAEGVDAAIWTDVGPLVALECSFHSGPHLDPSYLEPSATDVRRIRAEAGGTDVLITGLAATVAWDRCECGSEDPRLVLDG